MLQRDCLVGVRFGQRSCSCPFAGAGAVDKPLEEAIRCQPICSVQATTGHFSRCPQPWQGRTPLIVDLHPTDHVVGAGTNWNAIAGNVDPKLGTPFGNAGESFFGIIPLEWTQVEVNTRMARLLHAIEDRLADHVTRGEFRALVKQGHESLTIGIQQMRALAADRFGDEAPATTSDVEHRGMELHKLHIEQFRARTIGNGMTVARCDERIGRFTKELTSATGTQNRLLGPDKSLAMILVPNQGSATLVIVGQQIDRESVLPDLRSQFLASPLNHRPHDFLAGGISQGVGDSVVAVSSFATEQDLTVLLIKNGSPLDELPNVVWCFANHHFDDVGIAKISACCQGIGDMILDPIFGVKHTGDAALGVGAVRFLQSIFGDYQGRQLGINRHGCPHPRDSATDDEYIDEVMRYVFGMKRYEVARNGKSHSSSWTVAVPLMYRLTCSWYSSGTVPR